MFSLIKKKNIKTLKQTYILTEEFLVGQKAKRVLIISYFLHNDLMYVFWILKIGSK